MEKKQELILRIKSLFSFGKDVESPYPSTDPTTITTITNTTGISVQSPYAKRHPILLDKKIFQEMSNSVSKMRVR